MDRNATLKELHQVVTDTTNCLDRNHAILSMAIRYGAACALERAPGLDWTLVHRARNRRFAAMMRLVHGRGK